MIRRAVWFLCLLYLKRFFGGTIGATIMKNVHMDKCYTTSKKRVTGGFTIVELLIVIVVIAILATISIVAYRGVQDRARNAQRLSDAKTIVKALELYKAQTGEYPPANSSGQNAGSDGWEYSSIHPETFLQALKTANIVSTVPVDPVNTGDFNVSGAKVYGYYRYGAGTSGCDASRGRFYVLIIRNADGGAARDSSAPGFTCPDRDWSFGYYSIGGFTN